MHDKKTTTEKNAPPSSFVGRFDGYDDAPVQCQAQRPMQRVQGYLGKHWTPPLSESLPHIAPADAKVIDFWPKKLSRGVVKLPSEASIKKAQNEPSTQLIE